MIKNYKVRLHVLSPIHIGMGDAYDPTQFVIDKDGLMYVFDTNDFLKSIDSEKSIDFCKLAEDAKNPIPVFRFFRDNFDKTKVKYREVKVSKDLCERYEQICNSGSLNKDVINQFELKRTIYNPIKNVPYIPGSSLKGCLKTIWMSEVNKRLERPLKNEKDIKVIESVTLKGSFEKDPFRFIKISDLYPLETEDIFLTRIMNAVMFPRKINPDKKQRADLTVALEVIPKGNVFEGVISIDDQGNLPTDKRNPRSQYLNIDSLMKYALDYYLKNPKIKEKDGKEKQIESKTLSEINCLNKMGASGFSCNQELWAKKGKSCFPVRIGHHSSAEFITIDENKSIRISPIKVKPPVFANRATTVWLASSKRKPETAKGLQSFGWAMLEFEEMK